MMHYKESHHDLISLIEHNLRANALRLSRGKTGFHFSGSCSSVAAIHAQSRGAKRAKAQFFKMRAPCSTTNNG
jgi:hypothetical protein